MIPEVFCPIMKYHSRKVDYSMTPGLTQITWTSLNADKFLDKVEAELSQFEQLIKQVFI